MAVPVTLCEKHAATHSGNGIRLASRHGIIGYSLKFFDHPILRYSDIEYMHNPNGTIVSDTARRYSTTRRVSQRLSRVLDTVRKILRPRQGALSQIRRWDRFSSTGLLASRVTDMATPVRFNRSTDIMPLDTLRLDDFEFLPQQQPAAMFSYTNTEFVDVDPSIDEIDDQRHVVIEHEAYLSLSHNVNGKPSCAFLFHCTLGPKNRSVFCLYHHRVVARAILEGSRILEEYNRPPGDSICQSKDSRPCTADREIPPDKTSSSASLIRLIETISSYSSIYTTNANCGRSILSLTRSRGDCLWHMQ